MRGCNRGKGDVWYVGGMRVVSSMWEVSRGEWYVGPCTICFSSGSLCNSQMLKAIAHSKSISRNENTFSVVTEDG